MRMHTCCFDGARCSDSLGMPSARSAACHSANQFLSACSCAACFCCSRCCSAAASRIAPRSLSKAAALGWGQG